jgi:hypothetical protein
MSLALIKSRCAVPAVALALSVVIPAFSEDWQPIAPEELKMTSEPMAPGASAVYLYRQVDRDDTAFREYSYFRIKILTEEGRKYGDIQIPFVKGYGNIRDLRARTIHADGTIINFDGKIFEKTIVKARGLKFLAKTFTLPNVDVGSVVEVRYLRQEPEFLLNSGWILSEELFTKHAKFSLKKADRLAMRWTWPLGLPPGTENPKMEKNIIRLETHNVPAFVVEDYMPPQNQMKYRVDFIYSLGFERDADVFWKREATSRYRALEAFLDKPKAMEAAVSEVVGPNDATEVKLQKLYARVQQIRNLSFERTTTAQEQHRDKIESVRTVGDVWKHGYGTAAELTWLFLALVRAAGFEAYPVLISTRDEYFFEPKLMHRYELNSNTVLVKLDGKDLYFSPGVEFAPYGVLPWQETAVWGLRLDKDGGTWGKTPLPGASESRIERKAILRVTNDEGDLEGKLTVTFNGITALWRRTTEREEDDAARRKFLEDEVKECISAEAEVDLTNKPDWNASSPTLVAEFHLKVPAWVSAAGRRRLVSVGLFGKEEKHLFEHIQRVHPIYFHFPFQFLDDVTVDLPPGWQIGSLPAAQNVGGKLINYSMTADSKSNTPHWTRQLTIDTLLLQPSYYQSLREFYQAVRAADEQQIVLQPQ